MKFQLVILLVSVSLCYGLFVTSLKLKPKETLGFAKSEFGLNIYLFYESLCPACKEFITQMLLPVQKKLGQNFNLFLIPFGNANFTILNNKLTFDCQHGEMECFANKMESCGIKYILDEYWDRNNSNYVIEGKALQFVSCMEMNNLEMLDKQQIRNVSALNWVESLDDKTHS